MVKFYFESIDFIPYINTDSFNYSVEIFFYDKIELL